MKMTSLPHNYALLKTSHLYTQTFCIIEAIPQQCIVRAVNGTERETWGESRLEGWVV